MKYLYCVIPTNEPQTFDVQGIGGKVYTIPYEDISLVASDSEPVPFRSIKKEELVKYLLKHQSTIENIMYKYSVIPLKFGTFLDNEEESQKVMKKGYELFKKSLEALNGKIELDLVATWSDMSSVLKEIGEREEIKKLKDEVSQRPPGERIRGGIELGKMVKDLLDKKKDELAEEIIATLKDKAIASCKHAVLDESMIFNTAFLMDKDKKSDFEQALEALDKKFGGKINFKSVGPLPPYSFATFEIKKLTPEEIAYAKALLGLSQDPTPQEVKHAYHGMAQKLHPDKNPDNPEADKQFEELKRAFDILFEYSSNGRDLLSIRKLPWPQPNMKF